VSFQRGTSQRRGERGGGARGGQEKSIVCSVGTGVAGVGLPVVSRSFGEVRAVGDGGPEREGGMGKLGSTRRSRAICLGPQFGRRRSGKWNSTVRLSGGANGAVVVVLGHV
jgi:hypothetical protein